MSLSDALKQQITEWQQQSPEQQLYVAPANPAGRTLRTELEKTGIHCAGWVDNLKQGDNIYAPRQLASGLILVADGDFQSIVAEGLYQQGIRDNRIRLVSLNSPLSLTKNGKLKPYRRTIRTYWHRFRLNSVRYLFTLLRALCGLAPRRKVIYYAERFVDTNVLLTYRAHRNTYPHEAWLVAHALQQHLTELTKDPQALLNKGRRWWLLLRARALVVDHEYTGPHFSLIRHAIPVIQLWHGLPYKALSGNSHYPDVCDHSFISSSDWFNQHIFRSIFRARHYLAFGYPRNDALLQTPEHRDWCNAQPLQKLQQIQASTGPIIIYAPTYRDGGDNDYPLDLLALNHWCQQQGYSLVLKFHPFISRLFSQAMNLSETPDIQALPDYPHIYLYPSASNVYPWLADGVALITDYSSIAYDFMLTGKPIIYYQYDIAAYRQQRGESLMPADDFVLANQATKPDALLNTLELALAPTQQSQFAKHSQALLNKFSVTRELACPAVIEHVRQVAD